MLKGKEMYLIAKPKDTRAGIIKERQANVNFLKFIDGSAKSRDY